MHDEELASSRVRHHGSCHGDDSSFVLQIIIETVLAEFSLYAVARAAHAGTLRISALDHKAGNDSVENEPVIKVMVYKADEVVDGVRSLVRIELHLDNAVVLHGYGYYWILHGSCPFYINILNKHSKILKCRHRIAA